MRRLLIICFVCILVFSGCKDKGKVVNSNNSEITKDNDISAETIEITNQEEIVKQEEKVNQIDKSEIIHLTKDDILGHWEIEKATYKSTGKELPLQYLYGTGIAYGGGVDFFEDGTTDENIGITSDEGGDVKITYTIENGIIKVWVNGKAIREYEYIENAEKTCLRSLRDDYFSEEYYLYFEREYDEILSKTWWYQKNKVVKKGNKYGIISENNEILVPCKFDEISCFENEIYGIKSGSKYSLWLPNVSEGLSFNYDYLDDVYGTVANKFIVKNNGKYGVIDKNENVIISYIYDSLIADSFDEDKQVALIIAKTKNKYGVIDENGQVRIDFKYDELMHGNSGVWDEENGATYIVKLNEKYGVINMHGTEIIPCNYDKVEISQYPLELKEYYKVNKNNKWGMVSLENKEVIPIKYDEIDESDGRACKVRNGDNWGILNLETFEQTFPCKFKIVEYMQVEAWNMYSTPHICKVSEDGKLWGIVDCNGTTIAECVYEEIKNDSDWMDFYYMVKQNSKWGVLNYEGTKVIDFKYDDISSSDEDVDTYRYFVKTNGKYGLINENGKELVECKYNTKDEVKKVFLE